MTDDVVLGLRNVWGKDEAFALSERDRLQHLFVIGKSGVGKSTLLLNLIMQDIHAGRGVGVIDPHGDLCADILARMPRHRIEDVAYFDPSDFEHPVGLNLLAGVAHDRRHLVVSGIVAALKASWPEFFGPRMENILNHALAALLECENVSLLSLQRMLTDEIYRAWVVKQVKDPLVRAFWDREFTAIDKKTRAEYVAPILNKIGALLLAPQMRNVLGQVRNRMDARFMMDGSRIFLANLSKGKLGADKANLLGSLWVTQFHLAAMSRADLHEESRRDFHLYVDECHSFVSDTFISALAECRKYRLSLTLATQYLAQLRPSIRDAVVGNVGSAISFRVGYDDAIALEKMFGATYKASHFTSLSNGEVCAKILSGGTEKEPFTARTHPPPQPSATNRSLKVINRSREKYSTKRSTIEARISKWAKFQ